MTPKDIILPSEDLLVAIPIRQRLLTADPPDLLRGVFSKSPRLLVQAFSQKPRSTLQHANDFGLTEDRVQREIVIETGLAGSGKSILALGLAALCRDTCDNGIFMDYLATLNLGLLGLVDWDVERKKVEPNINLSLNAAQAKAVSNLIVEATQTSAKSHLVTQVVLPSTVRDYKNPKARTLGWPAIKQLAKLNSRRVQVSVVELIGSAFSRLTSRYSRAEKAAMSLFEAQQYAQLHHEPPPQDNHELKIVSTGANPYKAELMEQEVETRLLKIANSPTAPFRRELAEFFLRSSTREFAAKLETETVYTGELLRKYANWSLDEVTYREPEIVSAVRRSMIVAPGLALWHYLDLGIKNFTAFNWTWPPESDAKELS